jgi:hypothetical protein
MKKEHLWTLFLLVSKVVITEQRLSEISRDEAKSTRYLKESSLAPVPPGNGYVHLYIHFNQSDLLPEEAPDYSNPNRMINRQFPLPRHRQAQGGPPATLCQCGKAKKVTAAEARRGVAEQRKLQEDRWRAQHPGTASGRLHSNQSENHRKITGNHRKPQETTRKPEERIVNGYSTERRPWMAAFQLPGYDAPHCAGSLINHRYIM